MFLYTFVLNSYRGYKLYSYTNKQDHNMKESQHKMRSYHPKYTGLKVNN